MGAPRVAFSPLHKEYSLFFMAMFVCVYSLPSGVKSEIPEENIQLRDLLHFSLGLSPFERVGRADAPLNLIHFRREVAIPNP